MSETYQPLGLSNFLEELEQVCTELPLPENVLNSEEQGKFKGMSMENLGDLDKNGENNHISALPMNKEMQQSSPAHSKKPEYHHISDDDQEKEQFQVIETTQQFLGWFNQIEKDLALEQEQIYRDFIVRLVTYEAVCQNILSSINRVMDNHLNDLFMKFNFVDDKSKTIQSTCERVLGEQSKLTMTVEELRKALGFFNDLEPVARLFSSNDPNVCLNDAFIPMLGRIDDAISFLETKALRALEEDIRIKLGNMSITNMLETSSQTKTLMDALLYERFYRIGAECQFLLMELEERAVIGFEDYDSMRKECIQTYFSIRRQLMMNSMIQMARQFYENHLNELVIYAKSSIQHIHDWIKKEAELFRAFFKQSKEEFLEYAEEMCQVFYANLRPFILKETRIEVLSDLFDYIAELTHLAPSATISCVPLAKLAIESTIDSQNISITENSGDGAKLIYNHRTSMPENMILDSPSADPTSTQKTLEWMKVLAHVLDEYAQDIQQRLVFRAQAYVHQDIGSFRPRDEELSIFVRARGLKIPKSLAPKLIQAHSMSSTSLLSNAGAGKQQNNIASANSPSSIRKSFLSPTITRKNKYTYYGGGEWYPPVQKSLWILSVMYTTAPNQAFQEIAQECLELCRQSLYAAAASISKLFNKLDANLFLFKHFLYLRDEIHHHFSTIEFTKQEMTLGLEEVMSKTIQSVVRERRMNMQVLGDFGKGFFEAVTAPEVKKKNLDAKQMIDEDLKIVYEELIFDISQKTLEPILTFMLKAKALKASHSSGLISLFQAENTMEINQTFLELLEERFKPSVLKLKDHANDHPAGLTLFRYLKNNIMDHYTEYVNWTMEHSQKKIDNPQNHHLLPSLKSIDEMNQFIQNMWDDIV